MPSSSVHIAFDDVTLSLIPVDAPMVLAYVDGIYANYDEAVARFGAQRVRGITVHGLHGDHIYWCDSETGDLTTAEAIAWVKHEVHDLRHSDRGPYCQASNMQSLIDGLSNQGVSRSEYPTWSAHYGAGEHLCGPSTCGYTREPVDGTQFTDWAEGRSLDESIVTDRWLGHAQPVDPNAYPGFPTQHGARGPIVSHIQQRLVSAYHWKLKVDGDFGSHTLGAVRVFQRNHGLRDDGIVGPQTWARLFG